ncbi:hypothetical protein GCM10011297_07640 [Bacterioplanes sanyensis]|uniref:hypothetical protein n=1 Tax=Bacterioplanes sanyensis TaxID=1249553 RepID=UPI001676EDA6|nr:hypothetical protein [Bacterioplanes sanyensis]GGY37041.1 hypothetical protein GCM10011297_07640 [Bacterioplanes sanyensis]
MTKWLPLLVLGCCISAQADLVPVDDAALGEVQGAGLGVVFENFAFEAGESVSAGNRLDISGITNSSGQPVVLGVSQFYIAGSGSNQGANVIGNPVNLGRLAYPFNLELVNGDVLGISDKAIFEFTAPSRLIGQSSGNDSMLVLATENRTERRFPGLPVATGSRVDRVTGIDTSVLTSREGERPDMGVRFDVNVSGTTTQSLQSHITGLAVDGSYVRLWGDNNEMIGNLGIKAVADSLTFFACNEDGNNCGDNVVFTDFIIESELGSGEDQPVTFEVDASGNFTVEVGSIAGKSNSFYQNYYNNGPRTDVYIGDVTVAGQSFGSTTISNLQIQYLKATSRDL